MLAFLKTVVHGHLANVTKRIRQVVRSVHGIEVIVKKNVDKYLLQKTFFFYLQSFSCTFRYDRVKFSPADTYKPR